jgi:hypothetical protein
VQVSAKAYRSLLDPPADQIGTAYGHQIGLAVSGLDNGIGIGGTADGMGETGRTTQKTAKRTRKEREKGEKGKKKKERKRDAKNKKQKRPNDQTTKRTTKPIIAEPFFTFSFFFCFLVPFISSSLPSIVPSFPVFVA